MLCSLLLGFFLSSNFFLKGNNINRWSYLSREHFFVQQALVPPLTFYKQVRAEEWTQLLGAYLVLLHISPLSFHLP